MCVEDKDYPSIEKERRSRSPKEAAAEGKVLFNIDEEVRTQKGRGKNVQNENLDRVNESM